MPSCPFDMPHCLSTRPFVARVPCSVDRNEVRETEGKDILDLFDGEFWPEVNGLYGVKGGKGSLDQGVVGCSCRRFFQ